MMPEAAWCSEGIPEVEGIAVMWWLLAVVSASDAPEPPTLTTKRGWFGISTVQSGAGLTIEEERSLREYTREMRRLEMEKWMNKTNERGFFGTIGDSLSKEGLVQSQIDQARMRKEGQTSEDYESQKRQADAIWGRYQRQEAKIKEIKAKDQEVKDAKREERLRREREEDEANEKMRQEQLKKLSAALPWLPIGFLIKKPAVVQEEAPVVSAPSVPALVIRSVAAVAGTAAVAALGGCVFKPRPKRAHADLFRSAAKRRRPAPMKPTKPAPPVPAAPVPAAAAVVSSNLTASSSNLTASASEPTTSTNATAVQNATAVENVTVPVVQNDTTVENVTVPAVANATTLNATVPVSNATDTVHTGISPEVRQA